MSRSSGRPRCPAIDIEFHDVTYHVVQAGSAGKKEILHGISGKFLSGELTAIVGPSGAGKSTFLDILTGFRTTGAGGSISGGRTKQQDGPEGKSFRKQSRYIMQDDVLCSLFTASEIMHVAACCKLGRHLSTKAKQLVEVLLKTTEFETNTVSISIQQAVQRVYLKKWMFSKFKTIDEIVEAMGLGNTKDTACGRLSGGQKKRLSIALELLDNPSVIFLDEPTSGLDSSSSLQVVSLLETLARGGRTIVCTIHQPCYKTLTMFDHLYVIAEGSCVYQGSSENIVPFLSSVGLHCPQYHNPADYILEVASGEYGHFTDELVEATAYKCWRKPYKSIQGVDMELEGSRSNDGAAAEKPSLDARPPSEFEKFPVLLNRCFIQLYRDWTVTHLKCVVHLIIGLIIGGNYQNMGSDASRTISNVGFFMVTVTYLIFSSMMPSILTFPSELSVLKKEKFNSWYCLRTYYLAAIVSSIPVQIMFCVIHISVTYFLTAQPLVWSRYSMFLFMCVITTLIGDSLGQLFGTLFDAVNGTFLCSVLMCFMLLFGGFLCLISDMPVFVRWISYLSTMRYSAAGLALSVYDYGRDTVPCPSSEIYCHLREPYAILRLFGAPEGRYWLNAGVLICFLVFFRTATFYTLRMRVKAS